jgi:transcriptional regulator with XRE-family HTH domain
MSPLVVRLRALREEAGLSQDALADLARVTQSTVSSLELGKGRRVDLDILERIAKALGVSPLELFGENDAPSTQRRPRRR